MVQVDIQDLEYSYFQEAIVLNGINISIRKPQLVSIIGPNGVGKSTLIHCIDRILQPTKGTVLVDEKPVTEYGAKELAKVVGYVPYAATDTFPMTVVDTILMGRNPHRKWKSLHDDMVVVEEAMELMDIKPLAMRNFNELSAGQHQRVMLARGLAQEPQILLLDEPTANLDIRHQMEVTRLLKTLSVRKGVMVVMISHDLNLAAKYSDNIIMLSKGKVFAVGTPEEIITAENIREVYGVESEVIQSEGRPFMIIKDPSFENCGCEGEIEASVHCEDACSSTSVPEISEEVSDGQ